MTEQKYLALGAMRAIPHLPNFPLAVDHVEDNYDENGTIENFVIVTESGVRLKVAVDDEPMMTGATT